MRHITIEIGNIKIRAEIADTFLKKTKGLMFRKNLPKNEGMLFVFNKEDYHSIWMMNMRFPIDIIWVNKDMRVVDIAKNAQPSGSSFSSHKSREKAMYVLEVNANFTQEHELRIGSVLEITPIW